MQSIIIQSIKMDAKNVSIVTNRNLYLNWPVSVSCLTGTDVENSGFALSR